MQLLGKVLLYVLAIGVAIYAAMAYSLLPLGSVVHPEMKVVFQNHSIAIYTHIFASVVALVLGPFQFSSRLRQKFLVLHRWGGRAYLLIGVLVGGLCGLYMSLFSFGGIVSNTGFAFLALSWLFSGLMAFLAIRRRDIPAHRKWMIRNYSLTFAAVTLRIYIGISFAAGLEFEQFYPMIAWLCWVPNLLLAEWLFNSQKVNSAPITEVVSK